LALDDVRELLNLLGQGLDLLGELGDLFAVVGSADG
jgi:hypothetical protein